MDTILLFFKNDNAVFIIKKKWNKKAWQSAEIVQKYMGSVDEQASRKQLSTFNATAPLRIELVGWIRKSLEHKN